AVLSGAIGSSASTVPAAAPPAVLLAAATPAPSAARPPGARAAGAAIVAQPSIAEQRLDAARFVDQTTTHISRRWMEGFYPIYATAQETFGVNWLLLASIHRQESAFST